MVKTVSYTHTNSYETLFELTEKTKNIWICFHGLGYLAAYFKRYLEGLHAQDNFVIVLQAPSKSYIGSDFKHVGACWLTRVDTAREMNNNLEYIHGVLAAENLVGDPRIVLFGYSQGVSIAMRFLKSYLQPIKALLLHSGSIPEELTSEDGAHFKKYCSRFIHIAGTNDEYSTGTITKREKEKIELLFGTDCELYRPKIKHVVHVPLIKKIAKTL
ncbi:esterase [Nonlabens sp.]|uniref:alpha/beta hydrolase n=1 Tax=Nonlabens sp. TaxID=1888209 RepID=UPI0025E8B186|nr:esterase [Nonlabens sp.]